MQQHKHKLRLRDEKQLTADTEFIIIIQLHVDSHSYSNTVGRIANIFLDNQTWRMQHREELWVPESEVKPQTNVSLV